MTKLPNLRIMEHVFAPKVSIGQISYIEMLIEVFFDDFKLLYPNRPLVPKMHYLIHVPSWMRRLADTEFGGHFNFRSIYHLFFILLVGLAH